MAIDLGLSFDSDDYEHVSHEDADVFQRSTNYEHKFEGFCDLCERRHFPGLKIPDGFQNQLQKYLKELPVDEAQEFVDGMDEVANFSLPAQVASLAIEAESKKTDGEEIPVFLRSFAATLNDLTGGGLTRRIILSSLEQKIIDLHSNLHELDKVEADLIDETADDEPNISTRVRDLTDFTRGVRQKRLDNLINIYRDECEEQGVEPSESIIKEGKFAESSVMSNIMELLEGNGKL